MSTRTERSAAPDQDRLGIRSALDDPTAAAGQLAAILLADATSNLRGRVPVDGIVQLLTGLAGHPGRVVRRLGGLTDELASIGWGRSRVEPEPKDRRFLDPAWRSNPLLHRILQAHLAAAETLDGLVDDANLDVQMSERMTLLADNVAAAMAPSNAALLNPGVVRAAVDSRGASLVRGARALAQDLRGGPALPAIVDSSKFSVGEDMAMTAGAVVLRTPLLELIQYEPTTVEVDSVPLLLVPSMVNKYYLVDLSPGRSMVADALRRGRQCFVVSFVNPDVAHAGLGLDDYTSALLEALAAVEAISGSPHTHVAAFCAGTVMLAAVAGYLAAVGKLDRLASITLALTVLDPEQGGLMNALLDRRAADRAIAKAARAGYVDGRSTASMFAWIRPNEGIWLPAINNYLLGNDPPAFDLLFWADDATNVTAALQRDMIEITLGNGFAHPNQVRVLQRPIDLTQVRVDAYLLAGLTDHIAPWPGCYRSATLLGSKSRFVVADAGHAAVIVAPPEAKRGRYRTNRARPANPQSWLEKASVHQGSWWDDWHRWLDRRTGGRRPSPATLGDADHPPIDPAPGTYVRRRIR
jgi:polyhydroxyalkanoate synthase